MASIQESILFFYEKDCPCIVCSADNKTIVKNGKEYIKQGFHLHWPDIIINKSSAKKLRVSIVAKLNTICNGKKRTHLIILGTI